MALKKEIYFVGDLEFLETEFNSKLTSKIYKEYYKLASKQVPVQLTVDGIDLIVWDPKENLQLYKGDEILQNLRIYTDLIVVVNLFKYQDQPDLPCQRLLQQRLTSCVYLVVESKEEEESFVKFTEDSIIFSDGYVIKEQSKTYCPNCRTKLDPNRKDKEVCQYCKAVLEDLFYRQRGLDNNQLFKKRKKLKKSEIELKSPGQVQNGEKIIEIKHLEVRFSVRGKVLTAIRNVSLDIIKGEIIAIVGESGSGKSVTTKTLNGMLEENGRVSDGVINYAGVDLAKFSSDVEWLNIRGKRIAMIFQDPLTSLNPLRRIGSQIAEVIKIHRGLSKAEAKEEAISLLKRVGIPNAEKRYTDYPFQFSGGMRQRVVIAIALACSPDILICDEPTTALDVTIQAQILDLIKELKDEYGFTVIFITHDLGVVAEIADRVAVMYAGQIIELGTANDIFYNPQHPYTWALLSSLPQLGQKGEKLYSIPGTPPSLFNRIHGDAFAPRNSFALKVDFVEEAPLFKVGGQHYAKTWLLDPRAPKVERPKIISEIPARVAAIYGGGEKVE
jgi:oligopeptide transport system ATP-binding protein